jgi:hypothetical protein
MTTPKAKAIIELDRNEISFRVSDRKFAKRENRLSHLIFLLD